MQEDIFGCGKWPRLSVELTVNILEKTSYTVHRQKPLHFRLLADWAYMEGFAKREKKKKQSLAPKDSLTGHVVVGRHKVGSRRVSACTFLDCVSQFHPFYKDTIFLISSSHMTVMINRCFTQSL